MSNHFHVVVMRLKSPEHLVGVTDGKKQNDEEQENRALAKTDHQRNR